MAQSTPTDANGLSASNGDENGHLMVPGKRKRDNGDEDNTSDQEMEVDKVEDPAEPAKNKRDLIKPYFEALTRWVNQSFTPGRLRSNCSASSLAFIREESTNDYSQL